jgi:hypothetical protein
VPRCIKRKKKPEVVYMGFVTGKKHLKEDRPITKTIHYWVHWTETSSLIVPPKCVKSKLLFGFAVSTNDRRIKQDH